MEHAHAFVHQAPCSRWLTSGLATSDSEVRRNKNSVGNIAAWCVWCEECVRETQRMQDSFSLDICGRGSPSWAASEPARLALTPSYLVPRRERVKKLGAPPGQGSRFAPRHRHGRCSKKSQLSEFQWAPTSSAWTRSIATSSRPSCRASASGVRLRWSFKVVSARLCRRRRATARWP